MKKWLISFISVFCLLVLGGFPRSAFASESQESPSVMIYNFKETAPKAISYFDEQGNFVELTIEKSCSLARVDNGSYKISKTVAGVVSVSYYVTIKDNQFTQAYNLSINALSGSVASKNLSYNSNKATCSFTTKAGAIYTPRSVVATISNKSLYVS
ncbi:hypothetical protein M2139_002666 [Enterococcus sp. PF1-24]|uniref:DUF5626 family protein n=1 Tax=unclassified Enterococcus TaxID=2608891 RepID=UPI0024764823|nr:MULTISPECIES: DUF5626 family protein [unclassified Enterococcus]MDH6365667.1 hypothetical protein [Enterococcus sp. PFB1-1]MDH6402760.1 hypothetical protein [Enterococcus sp. PF1-24]